MSIYVTGDIHGDPSRFSTYYFFEQKEMTKDDYVIILGDFGLVWDYKGESKEEKYWLDWLEDKPFTTLFIDGNHENFSRLGSFPTDEWHGGLVHKIRPHVIHLMRGYVFNIDGASCFCFGGASSHDISDGIIDSENWKEKALEYIKKGKRYFRIKDISWWPEEMPSQEEMERGIKTLNECGWKVDFFFTHSPTASELALLSHGRYKQDGLTKYLEDIKAKLEYKYHMFGHMHVDLNLNTNDKGLYEQIIRVK